MTVPLFTIELDRPTGVGSLSRIVVSAGRGTGSAAYRPRVRTLG